ncbi:MAG: btuD 3 [Paenibacillaceae bacterium]|jgi:ABC-type lipoprotein export system ATPase subunit|nr:btuD 3 [Paenibacillaceae bacterium]
MMDYKLLIETATIARITELYPVTRDFVLNYNLEELPEQELLSDALLQASEERLAEFGCTRQDIAEQLAQFLETMQERELLDREVRSLTILGGRDKQGNPEDITLTVSSGEIISIVGPTGSGKSRLLGDIECIAQGDTPTGRHILINGKPLDDEERFSMEGRLVAQLSQNMNFVVDLTVAEFLEMHARSRLCEDTEQVVRQCFDCANELAGEKFSMVTKVTQLSGGQSRALMIADTAYMSASPVVLIDEIENAGIDRKQALSLLARKEKIVLISTHDPLLALSAHKRVVIRNGGIHSIMETDAEERESLSLIEALDQTLMAIRHRLRMGERILRQNLE